MNPKQYNWIKKVPPVVYMIVAMIVIFSLITPRYFSWKNFHNILLQCAPLMILGFAQTMIILTEGIDLSINAVVNMVTVLSVWLSLRGTPLLISMSISILMAVLLGVFKGWLVARFKLPPFIVCYGVQNVINSVALLITGGASIYVASDLYHYVTQDWLFLPGSVWIAALMFCISFFTLQRTKLGMAIRALGGNQEALTLAGMNIKRETIKTYAFAGFLTGVAGIVMLCRVESGQPVVADGLEFQAVAAAVLGGTSLRHGKGNVTGTILGVLLIQMIQNGLNISGLPAIYQNVFVGGVVLFAIIADAIVRRKAKV